MICMRPANLRLFLLSCLILVSCTSEKVSPGVGDHWHVTYDFYICDRWVGTVSETDELGNPTNKVLGIYHVHGHDDGLMHWHPSTNAAGGNKATLGLYLSFYEILLDDVQITLPNYLGGTVLEGLTVCETANGQVDGVLTVQLFEPGKTTPIVYTDNLAATLLNRDGLSVTVVFGPAGTSPGLPPSFSTAPND